MEGIGRGWALSEAAWVCPQAERYPARASSEYDVCYLLDNQEVELITLVPVIESITNIRDRQPDMEALYLLMPTTENVNHIIEDFPAAVVETARNARQPKYPDRHTDYRYKAAHVFFIDGICLSLGWSCRDLLRGQISPIHC